MLQNLETLAREARSWPFEQARNLLAHVLRKRLLARHGGHARLYRRFDRAEYVLVLLRGASAVRQGARHTTEAVPEALIDRASDAPYKGKELMLPRWYRWG